MPSNNRNINPYSPSDKYENEHMRNRPAKREGVVNQQIARAVRPQLPRDGTPGAQRWNPGQLPHGGFRTVFDFSGTPSYDTKQSPTRGSGKKVY